MRAPVYVAGRRIFRSRRDRTQTVNVCGEANRQGDYERVYRLDAGTEFSNDQIASHDTLESLHVWLTGLGAVVEGGRSLPPGSRSRPTSMPAPPVEPQTIFVVHGHDKSAKFEVAHFVQRITGRSPVILAEEANRGRTLIEKFEAHANVKYAIVIATPDDIGHAVNAGSGSDKPRARQNVVFELGFFFGRLGRNRVAVLNSGDVEKPSDVDGLVYISYPDGDWKLELAHELHAAGVQVDMQNIFGR